MIEVRKTEAFTQWMARLRDPLAMHRILVRIDRLLVGNAGQHRALGHGIVEMKIDHGPGYRVYYTRIGNVIVVLLCGGDKSTQQADIANAIRLSNQLET